MRNEKVLAQDISSQPIFWELWFEFWKSLGLPDLGNLGTFGTPFLDAAQPDL